jgi:hypothetical protein
MNIKSLLLGSAVAVVAATGARAADAIIIAEPEPMEFVRICDAYGTGFFYIPGTETCLRLGGYVRHEQRYQDFDASGDMYSSFTRFQLNVDARNETEWGTLRSYVEGRFQYDSATEANTVNLHQGFIELGTQAGTVRVGRTDTAYARYLGFTGPVIYDGSFGLNTKNEVSYTFTGGNGFSAILAAHDLAGDTDLNFGIEGGARLAQGWGDIGAIAGYDMAAEEWGAKLAANGKFGAFNVGAHVLYSSAANHAYAVQSSMFGGANSEISVIGYGSFDINEKLAVVAQGQWFDAEYDALASDAFEVTAGLNWRPITGLQIRPEVQYGQVKGAAGVADVDGWRSVLRFQRSF